MRGSLGLHAAGPSCRVVPSSFRRAGAGAMTWEVMATPRSVTTMAAMSLHSTPPTAADSFGAHLRHWRQYRRLSQLDLAPEAEVSTRHLRYVETGRDVPSREMVLRLAERLDV